MNPKTVIYGGDAKLNNTVIISALMESKYSWEYKKMKVKWNECCSVISDSLQPHKLYSPWNSLAQNIGIGSLSLLQQSSQTKDWTQVSHISSGAFTSWATREAHAKRVFYNQFSSVAHLCPTLCEPHGLQHDRLSCPLPNPRVCSNSCPSSQWCHPTISSSVIPFVSCLQSFPALGSFQMSQCFASSGQSIGVSALSSVRPLNIQDWFPLG